MNLKPIVGVRCAIVVWAMANNAMTNSFRILVNVFGYYFSYL